MGSSEAVGGVYDMHHHELCQRCCLFFLSTPDLLCCGHGLPEDGRFRRSKFANYRCLERGKMRKLAWWETSSVGSKWFRQRPLGGGVALPWGGCILAIFQMSHDE